MFLNVNPCQNTFALKVDDATGYISLPNHNKHEEMDENTQLLGGHLTVLYIRNRIYIIRTASPLRRKKPHNFRQFPNNKPVQINHQFL